MEVGDSQLEMKSREGVGLLRTTTRKTGESGDELFEGSDDDVLYESAHNDLEPEREQRARCVGCGAVSASGGERGFLCGSDNRTYSSLCRLDLHNCVRRPAPPVRLACRGFCPCRHDRRRTRIDREGALRRRTFDQSNDVLSPAHASSTATGRTGNVGTECSLDQMADRLLDWFSVLMQQSGAQPSPPSTSVDEEGLTGAEARAWRTCKPEVRWMFARLDADGDGRLSPQDLYALRHDERERCLRPFLATCAGGEGNVSRGAWCACLRRAARPCAALQSSIPARPGAYVPACDAAGFYRPLQCHAALGVCWCVDAHGVERPGSRTKGRPRCPPSARPAPPTPSLRPPADDEDALGLGSGDADLRF
ncbi:Proteoglycan Cow [Eumeta japonica]|uniref:Proteoglycan Cow n=1 Tax=Eumeta variegata TaxID=151549 RepID=A0A4C1XIZ3_EUMVA|nr:Proteoglycan Cow [Eumeta japonica]